MEISRYASRLAPTSAVSPSGRPIQRISGEKSLTGNASSSLQIPFIHSADLLQEPEDARLTGGTRSLSRRLLALNIPGISEIRKPPSMSAKTIPLKKQKRPKVLFVSSDLLPQDA